MPTTRTVQVAFLTMSKTNGLLAIFGYMAMALTGMTFAVTFAVDCVVVAPPMDFAIFVTATCAE